MSISLLIMMSRLFYFPLDFSLDGCLWYHLVMDAACQRFLSVNEYCICSEKEKCAVRLLAHDELRK